MNSNCSNLQCLRNLQEQVKKAFCYKKLFWTFTVWINCSSCLKNFANSRLSAITTHFFLTAGQNNFANKIPVLLAKNFLNGKAIGFLPRDYQYHTPYLYSICTWYELWHMWNEFSSSPILTYRHVMHLNFFFKAYWIHNLNKKCQYLREKNGFDHFHQKIFFFEWKKILTAIFL